MKVSKLLVVIMALTTLESQASVTALSKIDSGINEISITGSSLQSQVSDNADDIAANTESINNINTQITNLKSTLSTLSSQVSSSSSVSWTVSSGAHSSYTFPSSALIGVVCSSNTLAGYCTVVKPGTNGYYPVQKSSNYWFILSNRTITYRSTYNRIAFYYVAYLSE